MYKINLVAFLCIVMLTSPETKAQMIYSDWADPSANITANRTPNFLCTNLSCPVITSAANAVDRNLFNYTAVNFPLISLLSSVSLTMNVSQPVTNGSGGGVYMQALTGFGCSG